MFHICNLYGWFAGFIGNREWPVLHIAPDLGIVKFTANEVLGIERGILRAGMECAGGRDKNKRGALESAGVLVSIQYG